MTLSSLPVVALLVAVAVFVIVRQFQTRPVRPLPLVGLPLGLLGFGVPAVTALPWSAGVAAVLAVEVVAAVAFGVWRGESFLLWVAADGGVLRQGTRRTLLLWLASIALKLALAAGSRLTAGGAEASARALPVALGLTLGAQGIVILWRANRYAGPVPGEQPAG